MRKCKALSVILTICMLLSFAVPAFAADGGGFTTAVEARTAIVGYYEKEKPRLTDWEELVALKTAGADLTRFYLPDTAPVTDSSPVSAYANAIICELMKGYDPSALVTGLLSKQNPSGSGRFSTLCNEQIWAMIALNAAGASYNGIDAAKYLLSMQLGDGGFSYDGSLSAGTDADTTGAAAIALSPFIPALNTAAYQQQIQKIRDFFKNTQQADGSFASWGTSNASSTAAAIWGLTALGENLYSENYTKNGKSTADALLGFITKQVAGTQTYGYAYGLDWSANPPAAVPGQFDPVYTKQALIALSDILNGQSVYKNLSQYKGDYQYRTVKVRADSENANLVNLEFTAKSTKGTALTAKDALAQAFAKAGKTITFSGAAVTEAGGILPADGQQWMLFINGVQKPLTYALGDSDVLELMLSKTGNTSFYSFFDKSSVTDKRMGEDITLTLTCKNIESSAEEKKAGIIILVNGAPYGGYPNTTDANGRITLKFLQAGTYEISARTATGADYSITRPYCRVVIPSGAGYSKTVSVRVEGIESNIADQRNFTATATADKLLTVTDALKQVLDAEGIPYSESGGYISSIGGESGGYFGGWDGWLYLVNGASPSVGMSSYVLEGGEDIVVYYGDYGTTLYPKITTGRQADGTFKITFTADGYDENWNPVDVPITGANVTWNGTEYTTDSNGSVTIPAGDSAPGYYSLQIQKNGTEKNGKYLPCVVRLPSDYKVSVANKITAPSGDSGKIDLSASVSTDAPQDITVPSGATNTGIKVRKNTALPEISVTKGTLSMLIPQGTKVTSSDGGWDGTITVPQLGSGVTLTGKTVDKVITVGCAGSTLTFDKPVRLLIPGGTGKTIAYLDGLGNPVVIDTVVSADNAAAASASLTAAGKTEGRIDVGSDTAVWTKHFTTFISYTSSATPPSNTVTLSVTGYKGQTILPPMAVTLQTGDTPLSVLQRQAAASGFQVVTRSGYVVSVDGLAEFDYGPESGWMYKVNGTALQVGAGSYTLKAGDSVAWLYTTDLGQDLGVNYNDASQLTDAQLEDISESLDTVAALTSAKEQISDFELLFLALKGGNDLSSYKKALADEVRAAGGHYRKCTDLSRLILAARAAGLNPYDIGGCNLISRLVNFDNIEMQGVNGPAFALIAYDAMGLRLPENAKNSRENLKTIILSYQKSDGGFSLSKGGSSDVDITAMALTALAPYQSEKDVSTSIQKALTYLSDAQREDGGFVSDGALNCESAAQVMIALTSLGIDPMDERFVKKDGTLLDNLLSFKNGDGGFCHTAGGETDSIATEQAGLALLAYNNLVQNKGRLYDLTGVSAGEFNDKAQIASWAVGSAQSCKAFGIMTGDTLGNFMPKKNLTRAEASKILVNLMQIIYENENSNTFTDVPSDQWYAKYIAAAVKAGLVKGMGNGTFNPSGSITRQDFAVMLVRALGLKTIGTPSVTDIDRVSPYAKDAVLAVYSNGLMVGSGGNFDPKGPVSREMIAVIMERVYENLFE